MPCFIPCAGGDIDEDNWAYKIGVLGRDRDVMSDDPTDVLDEKQDEEGMINIIVDEKEPKIVVMSKMYGHGTCHRISGMFREDISTGDRDVGCLVKILAQVTGMWGA